MYYYLVVLIQFEAKTIFKDIFHEHAYNISKIHINIYL